MADGVARATMFGLYMGLATIPYRLARQAARTRTHRWHAWSKAAVVILGVAWFAAIRQGSESDCSEADGYRIGCETVAVRPVSADARWSTFVTLALVLGVSAGMGWHAGTGTAVGQGSTP